MSIKSIPCGGFMYDDETIAFEKDEYGRDVIKIEAGDTLPEVTAADNGKLLGVVNGEWGKVAGGGGSDIMVVEFSFDETTSEVTANKSVTEVLEAMLSSVVVGTIDMGDGVPTPLGSALIDVNLTPAFVLVGSESAMYMIDVVDSNWRMNI